MTQYGRDTTKVARSTLHIDSVNDISEKRRKVLDGVFERRKLIYKHYIRKLQHNLNKSEIDFIFD
jgi:hypothetical protein